MAWCGSAFRARIRPETARDHQRSRASIGADNPLKAEKLYARSARKVYATARNLRNVTHPEAIPVTLEVTDLDAVSATAELAQDVTILINNAGASVGAPFLGWRLDNVRREFDTNFYGPLFLTRAFAPIIEDNGRGHIGIEQSAPIAQLEDAADNTRC